MRYVIAKTIFHAQLLAEDPRVCSACMLFETFTPIQRTVAWLLWRTPVVRWLLRPVLRIWFCNPYSTMVFALRDDRKTTPAPAQEVPTNEPA